MADGIRFDVSGLDGIKQKMAGMKFEMNAKGGRFALRRAAKELVKQAQENARRIDDPVTAESISKNIVERWNNREFKRNQRLAFRVGVLGGARDPVGARRRATRSDRPQRESSENPGGVTFHWRFLEFGTSTMRAQPIFRPVAQQAGQRAVDVFARELNAALDRAIKKGAKQAKAKKVTA